MAKKKPPSKSKPRAVPRRGGVVHTDAPTRDVIVGKLTYTDANRAGRVVDIHVGRAVAYVAWERTRTHGPVAGRVAIIGVVVQHSRGDGEVVTRARTELEGPADAECPARILDKLSPVEAFARPSPAGRRSSFERATEWRSKCWAHLAARRSKAQGGTVVRFAEPIHFGRHGTFDTFRAFSVKGRIVFRAIRDGAEILDYFVIRKWRQLAHNVIG